MESITKIIFVDEQHEKFFGEGPNRLLRRVEETGSLRAAALSMEMSYTKALKIVNNAEKALGFALILRSAGGKSGGGSSLTLQGKAWLDQYEAYRDACIAANQKLYRQFFPSARNQGCVIMASGLGKRFGGNKLMADFAGKPLIQWALDATEGLFSKRVVVTRHHEVETLCLRQGIEVVYHTLPLRSDTVRLGVEAIGQQVEGCVFLPGDQPLLRRETVEKICQQADLEKTVIWRAAYGERYGLPVFFPRWAFEELSTLPEGKGGGAVIQKHPEQLRLVWVKEEWELQDVDTPEELRRLLTQFNRLS